MNSKFIEYCKKGKLDKAKKLYYSKTRCKWKIFKIFNTNYEFDFNYAFRVSCEYNRLPVVQWLYSLDNLDINTNSNMAFFMCCFKGHLELAKWLKSLKEFNTSVDNHELFVYSCMNNRLKMAQWLWSIGNIDIHKDNDFVFKQVCIHNKIEIARWLTTISNIYNIIVIDNSISKWKIIDYSVIANKKIIANDIDGAINTLNLIKCDDTSSELCIICLSEECPNMVKLNCNHYYCLKSIVNWFSTYNTKMECPYCSTYVKWNKCTIYD